MTTDRERKCVIEVHGFGKIDVVKEYKDRGFTVLPPDLTMTRYDIFRLSGAPMNRHLIRHPDEELPIEMNAAIIVQDGDVFIAVPPAVM